MSRKQERRKRSFSNGNAGEDEDLWSGWVLRPVHWWHWA